MRLRANDLDVKMVEKTSCNGGVGSRVDGWGRRRRGRSVSVGMEGEETQGKNEGWVGKGMEREGR